MTPKSVLYFSARTPTSWSWGMFPPNPLHFYRRLRNPHLTVPFTQNSGTCFLPEKDGNFSLSPAFQSPIQFRVAYVLVLCLFFFFVRFFFAVFVLNSWSTLHAVLRRTQCRHTVWSLSVSAWYSDQCSTCMYAFKMQILKPYLPMLWSSFSLSKPTCLNAVLSL